MSEEKFKIEITGAENKPIDLDGKTRWGYPYSEMMTQLLDKLRSIEKGFVRYNSNPKPMGLYFWVCSNPLCHKLVPDLYGKLPGGWRNVIIRDYKWASGMNGDISFVLCGDCDLRDVLDQLLSSSIGAEE